MIDRKDLEQLRGFIYNKCKDETLLNKLINIVDNIEVELIGD